MGDGNLDENFTSRFISKNKKDLEALEKLLNEELFIPVQKMKIRSKIAFGRSFVLQVNDSTFGRVLKILGAPQGRKTNVSFNIPNWINSELTKKTFLQGILEDELAGFRINRGFPNAPNFKMAKNPLLKQDLLDFINGVKNLIEEFDVKCSKVIDGGMTKSGNVESLFWIQSNAQNIISFSENIGFRFNAEKTEKMNKVVIIAREILDRKFDSLKRGI